MGRFGENIDYTEIFDKEIEEVMGNKELPVGAGIALVELKNEIRKEIANNDAALRVFGYALKAFKIVADVAL